MSLTYQGVIAAESKRKPPFLCMISDDLRDSPAYPRDEPGVLEFSDGRIVLGRNLLKLVVTVELDLPAKLG